MWWREKIRGFEFSGKSGLMQQVGSLKNGLLEPNPFGPNEVMLGGTPEILFPCPPNPMEVTEAAPPVAHHARP
ncbi:MAG: hypothetical protein AUI17_06365 [Acidobacteriales bacterium 13_2_20CM_2_55_5]|nr:MAG: hypothetical protein AUI17_06365 [Acidobacteriales bacterium 13_2_20CM_2_55_5]